MEIRVWLPVYGGWLRLRDERRRPGFLSPFMMAHMINSLDRVSDGRACLNVVCGWWRQEFEHCGVVMLDHRGRYRRAAECMHCLKGLWTRKPFPFEGEFYVLRDVMLAGRPMNRLSRSFWISGHSDDAICLAATAGEVDRRGSISEKIREFKAAGVDILMCQFEDAEKSSHVLPVLFDPSRMRKADQRGNLCKWVVREVSAIRKTS